MSDNCMEQYQVLNNMLLELNKPIVQMWNQMSIIQDRFSS